MPKTTFSTIALSIASLPAIAVGSESHDNKKPNVLFILVDDLGWNDLSCMGSTFYETPNVDRIARNGVKFTQGYAACQVSSPSRASILTGKTPARHGITSWIGDPSGEDWRTRKRFTKLMPAEYAQQMSEKETSIAKAFSKGGYSTIFVGKWHLGDKVSPIDYGFDVNIGGWASGGPKGGYFSPYENPALTDGPKGENLTMRLGKETIAQIEKAKEQDPQKPFFSFLSFYAVHSPIQTTPERWNYYRQKAISQGLEEEGFQDARLLPMRKKQDNPIYAGLMEQMDLAVGEVINYLETSGQLENTIVVFTGDNGGVVSGDNFSTNLAPLRGGKGMQWEGGIRVPYLIWNPKMDNTTAIIEEPVIHMDFYPTLLDMAGLNLLPKQHIDGESLVPLMTKGEDIENVSDRALYWHYPHYGNQGGEPSSIIREGDWKLIYYHEDGRYELYNIAKDISETTDLAKINKEITEELRAKLKEFLVETKAVMPTIDPTYNEQVYQEALKARKGQAKKRQEFIRKEQYKDNWEPNKTWWDIK